jgi:membrane-bound lytic murein transglycosylase B
MKPEHGASAPRLSQPSQRRPTRLRPSPPTEAREASVCRSTSFSPSAAVQPSSRVDARSSAWAAPGYLGMETAFGRQRGNQHTLSAGATLAYDCRRSAFFTEQLYAALALIDRGTLSAGMRGSMHGEIGQTQFLPKSILNYGTGGNLDNAADALASTANFLRAHGWRAGAGYQPGEANFRAIQAWNAASVYQRAIALMGQRIDGREGTSARR